jgi:hypothetical protein
MSLNYSTLLKISVAGFVLISVGACKPADKGQGALKSEGVAALNLSKSEASVFAKYFETEPCEVDELEALGALAGMGMGENGANGLSFASRNFADGLVTYRDIKLESEENDAPPFSAKTAVFHCPKMGDEDPGYDRLDLSDVVIGNPDATFTFGTLNIAGPTDGAAAAIIEGMLGTQTGSRADVRFEAVSVTDVTMKSDEVFGSLASLSWGEQRDDAGQGKIDMTIDALDVTVPNQTGGKDMTVDFKGMSARNMLVGGKVDPTQALSTSGILTSTLSNFSAFEKPYDQLLVETFKVKSEGFDIDFGGIEGKTEEDGDVITTRQSLKPSVISFNDTLANNPSFAPNYEILKSLGFETIKLSGSSVTTLDKSDDSYTISDGLFVVEDGFALNFEYSAEGIQDMVAKVKQQAESDATPDIADLYGSLELRNLRLTLEDNSIVEKGLKLASQMTGQNEQALKLGLGAAVFFAAGAANNEIQAEVYTETVEAFADFVKNGGSLTIEANPPEPVSLAPLLSGGGEDMDPEALGFSAYQSNKAE